MDLLSPMKYATQGVTAPLIFGYEERTSFDLKGNEKTILMFSIYLAEAGCSN